MPDFLVLRCARDSCRIFQVQQDIWDTSFHVFFRRKKRSNGAVKSAEKNKRFLSGELKKQVNEQKLLRTNDPQHFETKPLDSRISNQDKNSSRWVEFCSRADPSSDSEPPIDDNNGIIRNQLTAQHSNSSIESLGSKKRKYFLDSRNPTSQKREKAQEEYNYNSGLKSASRHSVYQPRKETLKLSSDEQESRVYNSTPNAVKSKIVSNQNNTSTHNIEKQSNGRVRIEKTANISGLQNSGSKGSAWSKFMASNRNLSDSD
ncbi:hypothetical protein BB560_001789 [Smittium megazygosporum]|uniref:Uncharacterized protein n=1 Tax=Smittium megazygosporum TaxID=133381 RepID=A0A2T9ZGR5_9FUNG|nr:hypothetical protein BB560_001789 [Smittium megazygosporum]